MPEHKPHLDPFGLDEPEELGDEPEELPSFPAEAHSVLQLHLMLLYVVGGWKLKDLEFDLFQLDEERSKLACFLAEEAEKAEELS